MNKDISLLVFWEIMKGNNSIISKIQLRFNVDIETNPFYFIFFFIFFFIIYLSFFKSGVVPETKFFFNQIRYSLEYAKPQKKNSIYLISLVLSQFAKYFFSPVGPNPSNRTNKYLI